MIAILVGIGTENAKMSSSTVKPNNLLWSKATYPLAKQEERKDWASCVGRPQCQGNQRIKPVDWQQPCKRHTHKKTLAGLKGKEENTASAAHQEGLPEAGYFQSWLVSWYWQDCGTCGKDRGQLLGISPLLPPCETWEPNSGHHVGCEHLYPQSNAASSVPAF